MSSPTITKNKTKQQKQTKKEKETRGRATRSLTQETKIALTFVLSHNFELGSSCPWALCCDT